VDFCIKKSRVKKKSLKYEDEESKTYQESRKIPKLLINCAFCRTGYSSAVRGGSHLLAVLKGKEKISAKRAIPIEKCGNSP